MSLILRLHLGAALAAGLVLAIGRGLRRHACATPANPDSSRRRHGDPGRGVVLTIAPDAGVRSPGHRRRDRPSQG